MYEHADVLASLVTCIDKLPAFWKWFIKLQVAHNVQNCYNKVTEKKSGRFIETMREDCMKAYRWKGVFG